jgi:hypothetical protein
MRLLEAIVVFLSPSVDTLGLKRQAELVVFQMRGGWLTNRDKVNRTRDEIASEP